MTLTDNEAREIARGNIEQNLEEHSDPDMMYSEAQALGFKALTEAGADKQQATKISLELAMDFACP